VAKFNRLRLADLVARGVRAAKEAEDIPLGSLAHAIAQSQGCTITLTPVKDLSVGSGHACRYSTAQADWHVIVYEPSQYSPGTLDTATRFSIAHELAHILLDHPPQHTLPEPFQNGAPSAIRDTEEFEANFLASVFLIWNGGPEKIKLTPFEEIEEVLSKVKCSGKSQIMGALKELVRHPSDLPFEIQAIHVALRKYIRDKTFRESVDRDVNAALACHYNSTQRRRPMPPPSPPHPNRIASWAVSCNRTLPRNSKRKNPIKRLLTQKGVERLANIALKYGTLMDLYVGLDLSNTWGPYVVAVSRLLLEITHIFRLESAATAVRLLLAILGSDNARALKAAFDVDWLMHLERKIDKEDVNGVQQWIHESFQP